MQLVRGVRGVPENDPWHPWPLTVPGQRVHEHPGPQDHLRQVRIISLAGQRGERDEQVQPGRDALDAGRGQVHAQRAELGVAPGPLPLAD